MFGGKLLRRKNYRVAAFTLMEIILVVVIIGIMLSLVAPRLVGKTEKARKTAASRQIDSFKTALQQYEFDVGDFPEKLDALVEKPSSVDEEIWKGPYLADTVIPKDPWGREYNYRTPGEHYKDYDIWSTGKDGQSDTEDDITSWTRKE